MKFIQRALLVTTLCIYAISISARVGGFNRNRIQTPATTKSQTQYPTYTDPIDTSHTTNATHTTNTMASYDNTQDMAQPQTPTITSQNPASQHSTTSQASAPSNSPAGKYNLQSYAAHASDEKQIGTVQNKNHYLQEQVAILEEELRYLRDENRTLRINLSRLQRKKQRLAEQLAAQLEDERFVDPSAIYHQASHTSTNPYPLG